MVPALLARKNHLSAIPGSATNPRGAQSVCPVCGSVVRQNEYVRNFFIIKKCFYFYYFFLQDCQRTDERMNKNSVGKSEGDDYK